MFVMVMGTGISSNILFAFPYEARWLRICSYPMFAVACLLFVSIQALQLLNMYVFIREQSFTEYCNAYFRNLKRNVFWGTYPMGFATIINYIVSLARYEVQSTVQAKRMMRLAYVFWWYDVAISLFCAWGISFLIWQKYYFLEDKDEYQSLNDRMATEELKSVLLMLFIPLVVAASSSSIFTMSDLFSDTFNRDIQLMTMVVTTLIWLNAIILVFIFIVIYFWSLYVNKIPPLRQVFTLFLLIGPMGQGSFGILLLTDNIRLYVDKYYSNTGQNMNYDILLLVIPWCFKILGLMAALALLAMGFFFSVLCFISIASYFGKKVEVRVGDEMKFKRIYNYHKGWFAMTFPMGTMSLGSTQVWLQYNDHVPMKSFRVIGAIYAVLCIGSTLVCLAGTFLSSAKPTLMHFYKSLGVYYAKNSDLSSESSKNATCSDNRSVQNSPTATDFTRLA